MIVMRRLLFATLSLAPQLQWQAAEAKCSHTAVKSLPLENHSSVTQQEKEERGTGGRREMRDGEGEESRTGGTESVDNK